jgi:Family of unknown function (DUF5329)
MRPVRYWTSRLCASFCCIILGVVFAGGLSANGLSESEKIQRLIAAVETSNVVFIRNGGEYNSKAAADHMRLKLSRAGSRISTARDFIRYIGTRSSTSGQPYYIRTADGRRVESATWLNRKLAEIEAQEKACCEVGP